jgi:hypothetical protein
MISSVDRNNLNKKTMEKIRGKSLKEWKEYCKEDKVPLNTMKYIIVLEEQLEAVNYTHCCTELCDHSWRVNQITNSVTANCQKSNKIRSLLDNIYEQK